MHADEALRESEQQLRRLVDALPTQIWAATPKGEPSYLNRKLADYVGLTLKDLDAPDAGRLQVAIQSSVHPDDTPSVGRALAHSFTTRQGIHDEISAPAGRRRLPLGQLSRRTPA